MLIKLGVVSPFYDYYVYFFLLIHKSVTPTR